MAFQESRLRGKIDGLKASLRLAENVGSTPGKIADLKRQVAEAETSLENYRATHNDS